MNLDQARPVLVQEARELLADMEAALLQLERGGADGEWLNAVFRAVHTIKGSAGIFELEQLVRFAHAVETVLEAVRAGGRGLDDELLSLLFACGDYIGRVVTEIEQGRDHSDPEPALRLRLLDALEQALQLSAGSPSAPRVDNREKCFGSAHWHISLRPAAEVLRNGLEPISFLRYLSSLGRIVHLHTLTSGIPAGEAFDPTRNYLGYELEFATGHEREAIEGAFDLMRGYCSLWILPPHSSPQAYRELLVSLPEPAEQLLEIFRASAALDESEVQQVLRVEAPAESLLETMPEPLPRQAGQLFIKVDVGKLDALINLVGELVIAQASARTFQQQAGDAAIAEAGEVVSGLVEHIRDVSLALRMVAVGEVFQRFPRVVRDLGREMGKTIELQISGAETELDKSMVEKLADPLLHLVRNAIDHGIELPAERLAAGKPVEGVLRLNAWHEAGSVVIEVADDGRGLDYPRIHAKALALGLIRAGQVVTEQEVFDLIFQAGFSTAESVSSVSGRGVGMDVVRTNIEKLRGEIEITSVAGQGSTVRIRLPLTLAIIEGFQVRVAGESFVLPLEQVVECVDLAGQAVMNDLLNLRGEPLPFVRLRQLFAKPAVAAGVRESLLVVQFGALRAGVVVDELVGELQAVIKPLGHLFARNPLLSGSTILGDGSVALILDVAQLIKRAGALAEACHSGV